MQRDLKILIIDDDEDFRTAVGAVLESHGYQVFRAASGREGLRALVEHDPDAVLVDVMMESPDEGYSFTYSLRNKDEYARWRKLPLFMISSIEASPDELFPLSMYTDLIRPDRYLTKPLDIPRLLDLLRQAIPTAAGATAA